ncbi:unnamed protein product [marine sediment metagenome]|uniref:Uncharacterized protein n=1 Tax=marine sediment metagenome TaxID=412755 RepID=X0YKT7_9ZZZZ
MGLKQRRTAFGLPSGPSKTKTHRRGLFIDGKEWSARVRAKMWHGSRVGFNTVLVRPYDGREFKGFFNFLTAEECFDRLTDLIHQGYYG